VNSGGFENYFRAWGGNSAGDALAALPTLLGHEWADLLRAAMGFWDLRIQATLTSEATGSTKPTSTSG
jgi:hypothetical protein